MFSFFKYSISFKFPKLEKFEQKGKDEFILNKVRRTHQKSQKDEKQKVA